MLYSKGIFRRRYILCYWNICYPDMLSAYKQCIGLMSTECTLQPMLLSSMSFIQTLNRHAVHCFMCTGLVKNFSNITETSVIATKLVIGSLNRSIYTAPIDSTSLSIKWLNSRLFFASNPFVEIWRWFRFSLFFSGTDGN